MSHRAAIFDADDPPSKAATLDAALSLFVRHGIDATSVRDIASRSGFTNPAIFKHFDSKSDMALCLFERCYGWMTTASAPPPKQPVRKPIRALVFSR